MKASVKCIIYYKIKMYKKFILDIFLLSQQKQNSPIMTRSLLAPFIWHFGKKLRMTRNQSSVMDACVVLQGVQILE